MREELIKRTKIFAHNGVKPALSLHNTFPGNYKSLHREKLYQILINNEPKVCNALRNL